jgi:hypothetical protein
MEQSLEQLLSALDESVTEHEKLNTGSPSKVSRRIPQAGNCAPKSAIKRPDRDEVSLDSVRLIFYTPDDLRSMGSWRVGSSYSRPWFLEGEGCSG